MASVCAFRLSAGVRVSAFASSDCQTAFSLAHSCRVLRTAPICSSTLFCLVDGSLDVRTEFSELRFGCVIAGQRQLGDAAMHLHVLDDLADRCDLAHAFELHLRKLDLQQSAHAQTNKR